MTFATLGLDSSIVESVVASGYTEPTPVQREAIPAAISGKDLLVSSHTGSGKTAAFLLPSLQRLLTPSSLPGRGPRMLVLTPTRELALQVQQAANTYGRKLRRLRTACLVGGSSYTVQLKQLREHIDIVVATPGRLLDHMERGRIDFARLEIVVLDEADRMLDMGFIDDINAIMAATPETRQTLMFSATLDGVVGNLARKLTRDPMRIEIASSPTRKANIDQKLLFADSEAHKAKLLHALLSDEGLQQAVVFTATKRAAEEISDTLRQQGFSAAALHGDMHQQARNRTLARLRQGETRVLVATDVAARGIDVAGISHVINFDAPRQAEDYVHRIGRTGRAGRSGTAFTLVHHREKRLVRDIERYTGDRLEVAVIAGLEPSERPQFSRDDNGPRRSGGGGYRGGPRQGAPRPGGARQGSASGQLTGERRPRAPAGDHALHPAERPSFRRDDGARHPEGGFRRDGAQRRSGPSRNRPRDF